MGRIINWVGLRKAYRLYGRVLCDPLRMVGLLTLAVSQERGNREGGVRTSLFSSL